MARHRPERGSATMIEFALVAPIMLLILFALIDFGRAILMNTSVADAARQGARQAAANSQDASPFGTPNGSCSGTTFTYNVQSSTTGCLSDQGIDNTVSTALQAVVPSSQITLKTGVIAANCGTGGSNPPPAAGFAYLCISQPQTGAIGGSAPANCSGVWSSASYPSGGTLGGRQTEFTNNTYKGCYLIQTTVVYTFTPWTPLLSQIVGNNVVMRSSTATIAEY